MRRILFTGLLLFGMLFFFACHKTALHIANASFETTDSTGQPAGWSTAVWEEDPGISLFTIDSTYTHTGNFAALIGNREENHAYYEQKISIPDKRAFYRLTCWIRTMDVPADTAGANIVLNVPNFPAGHVTGTSGEWQQASFYAQVETGVTEISIVLSLGYNGALLTGRAWFDDVEMTEISAIPQNERFVVIVPDTPSPGQETIPRLKELLIIFLFFALFIACAGVLLGCVFVKTAAAHSSPSEAVIPAADSRGLPWHRRIFRKDFVLFSLATLFLWIGFLLLLGFTPGYHSMYDQHTRQALAWQQGRIDLADGEELTYLEVAPFNGKWYVSFPPAPTLIEFPFTLFFGIETPSTYTQVFFTWLAMLFSFFIFLRLTSNRLLSYLLAFSFFWGSNILYLSLDARVWHQGQIYGVFFAIGALLVLVYSRKAVYFAGGAFLLALAAGCRPFYLFMVPFYMYHAWKRFPGIKTLIWIVIGSTPPWLFYMIYNQLRFGRFWEFGHRYLGYETENTMYTFGHLVRNIGWDFFGLPYWDKVSGLIKVSPDGSAIWLISPVILLGFALFFKRGIPAAEKILGGLCLLAIWIPLLMHDSNGRFQFGYRFSIDLIPLLLLFTARTFRKNHLFLIPLAAYSVLVNAYGAILYYTGALLPG